ncbi:MAG: hypothetical protein R3C11_06000 [Planctomycetaceae bacterium]
MELQQAFIKSMATGDARMYFQYALSAGAGETTQFRNHALNEMVHRGELDQWTRAAILSSATNLEGELLASLLRDEVESGESVSGEKLEFISELADCGSKQSS